MPAQQDIRDTISLPDANATPPPHTDRIATEASLSAQPHRWAQTWDYLKSRFDKEHWFGSTVLIAHMSSAYQTIRASLARKVHGEPEVDRIRFFSGFIPIAGYGWSFLSERGARFPEGNTVPKRMKHALTHPNQSSAQFEFLLYLIPNIVAFSNNIHKGLKAHGVGLKEGEKPYTPEKVRLYTGSMQALSHILSGYGHFRKHEDQPETPPPSPHKTGIAAAVSALWQQDRTLLFGTLIKTATIGMSLTEAWKKTSKSKEEAVRLFKAIAIDVVADLAYDAYIFERLYKSNFAPAVTGASKEPQQQGLMEPAPQSLAEPSAPKVPFTQKIQQKQKSQPTPRKQHSFTALAQQAYLPDMIEWSP